MLEEIWKQIVLTMSRLYVRLLSTWNFVSHAIYVWYSSHLENVNRRTIGVIAFMIALCGAVYFEGIRAPHDFPMDEYVTIEEGETLSSLSMMLQEKNIVRSAWWLRAIIYIRGGQHYVQAGDYLFASPINAFTIARKLTTGAYGLVPISITIPEGATVADMSIIYSKRLFKFDPEQFFKEAIKYEGYLYPDTYYFLPNAREHEVLRAMRDNFDTHILGFEEDIKESPYTLHEILTLASIIEKEAWKEDDRQLISGVLHNRLDQGMLLQVDATFTYTHDKGTYDITRDELTDEENLYNTYVHKGLPPGPIAAVGESSLYAALHPKENDYLFYLADRKGTTYYSKTYSEHLSKKRQYVD